MFYFQVDRIFGSLTATSIFIVLWSDNVTCGDLPHSGI